MNTRPPEQSEDCAIFTNHETSELRRMLDAKRLSDEQITEIIELLKARRTTISVFWFVRETAKWLAALAAGIAAYKFLFLEFISRKP